MTDMKRYEAQAVQMAHVEAFCPSEVFPSSDNMPFLPKTCQEVLCLLWLLIFNAKEAICMISIYYGLHTYRNAIILLL